MLARLITGGEHVKYSPDKKSLYVSNRPSSPAYSCLDNISGPFSSSRGLAFFTKPKITFGEIDYARLRIKHRTGVFNVRICVLGIGNGKGHFVKSSRNNAVGAVLAHGEQYYQNPHGVSLRWIEKDMPPEIRTEQVIEGDYGNATMKALTPYLSKEINIHRGIGESAIIAFGVELEQDVIYFAGNPPIGKRAQLPQLAGDMQMFRVVVQGEDILSVISDNYALLAVPPSLQEFQVSKMAAVRQIKGREKKRVIEQLTKSRPFGETGSS